MQNRLWNILYSANDANTFFPAINFVELYQLDRKARELKLQNKSRHDLMVFIE
jgi:hypothetical protein